MVEKFTITKTSKVVVITRLVVAVETIMEVIIKAIQIDLDLGSIKEAIIVVTQIKTGEVIIVTIIRAAANSTIIDEQIKSNSNNQKRNGIQVQTNRTSTN